MINLIKSLYISDIFNYKGVISRKAYLLTLLYVGICFIPLLFFPLQSFVGIILGILFIWTTVAFVSLNFRRLRDAGKSVWWTVALYLPILIPTGSDLMLRQTIMLVCSIPFLAAVLFLFKKTQRPIE
jgi:uncharacterized membrane protein YhaH (DUF805 family)